MAIARQVITSLQRDGTDMLGNKVLAVKIADESIVSGSLLTVESNHFCILKSRGAVLNVYETGQYALTTPDKPLLGSIAQGFFGGSSPWVYEVIYINRSKLLIRSEGVLISGPDLKTSETLLPNCTSKWVANRCALLAERAVNSSCFNDETPPFSAGTDSSCWSSFHRVSKVSTCS